jgi:hypothetical protein
MKGGHALGDGGDASAEFGGMQDFGVFTPAEDPSMDFVEAVESEAEEEAGVGLDQLLGVMPGRFADQSGGPGIKTDFDLELLGSIAAMDPEGTVEVIGEMEVGGRGVGAGNGLEGRHAGQGEGPDGAASGVPTEEVPFEFETAEMIAMNLAEPGFGILQALVTEVDLAVLPEGMGELAEEFDPEVFKGGWTKGDQLGEIAEMEPLLAVETEFESLKAFGKDLFDGGAGVGGEELAGDKDGEDFGFGEWAIRESLFRVDQIIAMAGGMIFDGDLEVVAEGLDIALDGAGTDLEPPTEGVGVGVGTLTDDLVDLGET